MSGQGKKISEKVYMQNTSRKSGHGKAIHSRASISPNIKIVRAKKTSQRRDTLTAQKK